jgi:hypothetical protein
MHSDERRMQLFVWAASLLIIGYGVLIAGNLLSAIIAVVLVQVLVYLKLLFEQLRWYTNHAVVAMEGTAEDTGAADD